MKVKTMYLVAMVSTIVALGAFVFELIVHLPTR
jgi:hypothetical protein